MRYPLLALLALLISSALHAQIAPLSQEMRFKALALTCLHQEYPNKISHTLASDADVAPPRELTPVFYGCFDWHSAVHGHWLLVRLLRLYPDDADAAAVETALDKSFQPDRVAAELSYIDQPGRPEFERPYGAAWFLQLMAELREWDDPRAARWRETLEPLEAAWAERMGTWLNKLSYPIRVGEHAQTAFAFALFIDWARIAGDEPFADLVSERSRQYYLGDIDCPLAYEPGGQDFLSPCLAEADLMRRVLRPPEYAAWLQTFLPGIPTDGSADWLPLAVVTDRTDGKLAHLDGLHLSRAWALRGMASGLPGDDPRIAALEAAAREQGEAGLAAVTGEHYAGGHWLASFATYLETRRGTGLDPGSMTSDGSASHLPIALMRARMARWEPSLNAVIALSPNLDEQSRALMAKPGPRGPLHGMPVLLKDNIESIELPTTAGSLALAQNFTGRDAELTRRLREAGLVVAGKTNLSEWANFRDNHSTSGWSAVGGLTPNAWDVSRTACGSSSGSAVAVAAGYVPFAVATETDGSIVCPASYNGVVGIKPTVGLVSRRGIVPISHSQDTAGPVAVNVKLAALLLSAMEGEDPEDPATVAAHGHFGRDYVSGLNADSLKGLRIGVIRSVEIEDDAVLSFNQAVDDLRAAGAALTDDLAWPDSPKGFDEASLDVLLYEFKHDLNVYLATLPGAAGQLNLERLIEFNQAQAELEMPWFGQDLFLQAQAKGGLDSREYQKALKLVQRFTRRSIDGLLKKHGVDVLVMPTNALASSIDLVHGDSWHGGSSSMAAIAGYPHITVPSGKVKGLPTGLSFVGAAFSEPVLIRAAYGYEQATHHTTTLEGASAWDGALDPALIAEDPAIACDQCAEWNKPLAPFRVFGNTWYVGTAGLSAILIATDDGLILIDAALPQSAGQIAANIQTLGFDPQDIRIILNSHAHFDHAGGINALQRLSGARVLASAGSMEVLSTGQLPEDDPQFAFGPEETSFPAVSDVGALPDGGQVELGGVVLTLLPTPGHTPGGSTWTWESCEAERCLAIVYADSLSAVAAEGFLFTAARGGPPVADQLRASIGQIRQLDCDILLAPHPMFFQLDEKLQAMAADPDTRPFVDPNACVRYADTFDDWLARRLAEEAQTQAQAPSPN